MVLAPLEKKLTLINDTATAKSGYNTVDTLNNLRVECVECVVWKVGSFEITLCDTFKLFKVSDAYI